MQINSILFFWNPCFAHTCGMATPVVRSNIVYCYYYFPFFNPKKSSASTMHIHRNKVNMLKLLTSLLLICRESYTYTLLKMWFNIMDFIHENALKTQVPFLTFGPLHSLHPHSPLSSGRYHYISRCGACSRQPNEW